MSELTAAQSDSLAPFLEPTRTWLTSTLGQPTPPQTQGWPPIQAGDHTLILAPTGSGKTLAAFLWAIDQLFREQAQHTRPQPAALSVLYISPLKALNNDIDRNLRRPLAGIRQAARALGQELPDLSVAVRSGDTPSRERQAMLRKPPHILITTPESLYILLTSPKARELFRTVRTVIVDEIHTLAGSKRGVHLALSLERLQQLADHPIQRIGLSATIRPLDEVARYLGGYAWQGEGASRTLFPRPVTIVAATYHKQLDLLVESVVEDFRSIADNSVWPVIVPRVVDLIDQHRSTLIFVNNRRLAERAADWINEARSAGPAGLYAGGVVKGIGMFGAGTGSHANPIRAHHGSMSKETRLALESDLKAGLLPAIIGTSSLELGIDIGAVDLVVQLQAPKAVAQGLQRVGRAGHLVGQTSKGRIFPTHREDVMEAAAVAGGMLTGAVEQTHTPRNPLDVLAQQIVAMVSVESWDVDALFDLVRCAYPYSELTERVFRAVLEMLAGRYPSLKHRELRPRLVWDTVNNRLASLPGSRLLAMTNGGVIPDRGAFGAYLAGSRTKLGELDEEFVYETRIGDTFTLGSQVWRVVELTDDKVMVENAAGATPRMPFWRGDFPWRPYELGQAVGAFRRAVAERLEQLRTSLALSDCRALAGHRESPQVQALLQWLRQSYALDDNSAWIVVDYVASQLDHAGAISSDRTILVEVFDDALGDPRMVIQSPFGGRVNGLWGIALAGALRERTGVNVEVMSNDDGILFRFPDSDADFPLDVVTQMTPAEGRERILAELPDSAVFGAQFRQNAARALLLPGAGKGKRTPFWLQRLRAKDLLQLVRHFDDFPIVAETYRDCLQEVMDLPHLEVVLNAIQRGEIQMVALESITPSPVAQSLLWDFISVFMYEWDAPKAERQLQTLAANRDLLQDLLKDIDLADLLRSEAVAEVRSRLQHTAPSLAARTVEELALLFQTQGDLSAAEIAQRTTTDPASWVAKLAGDRRIVEMEIPTAHGAVNRWVAADYAGDYALAFTPADQENRLNEADSRAQAVAEAAKHILLRFLEQAGPVTTEAILARYAFPAAWLDAELEQLVAARQLAQGRFTPASEATVTTAAAEFVDRRTLEQMHRRTLTILRSEVRPVPFAAYADFLTRWQHIHPGERLSGAGSLSRVLQQLRGLPVVGRIWERDLLPLRLARYESAELAALCQSGELIWVGAGGVDPRRGRIRFLFRGDGGVFLEPAPTDLSTLSGDAQQVYAFLKSEGAVFQADLRAGLGLSEEVIRNALLELVMAGLATNDSLSALQRLVLGGAPRPVSERKALSSLEADLAERLAQRAPTATAALRRPNQSTYQAAKRRVAERLGHGVELTSTTPQEGRWTLVHRFGVLGKLRSGQEMVAQQARQLLARHGVVTFASLSNEIGAWEWSAIYQEMQRLEMRGEVRRGYFVQGLPGVQFALPEVVERLRSAMDDEALVLLNACDPANLYGSALSDSPQTSAGVDFSFSRIPSTWLVQQRGSPVFLVEHGGSQITTAQTADESVIQRAVQCWLEHAATFEHRISVERWNSMPVLQSAGQTLLEACGLYRDYPGMTWVR